MQELIELLSTRKTIPQWLHRWSEPDAALTPVEIVAYWCARQMQRKTLREWGQELGPRLQSEQQQPHEADTPPLDMMQAALIAALSANDRTIDMAKALTLLYEHVNIGALHQAATDPTYPRNQQHVEQMAAYVRGEAPPPPYVVEAVKALTNGRGSS